MAATALFDLPEDADSIEIVFLRLVEVVMSGRTNNHIALEDAHTLSGIGDCYTSQQVSFKI